MISQCWRQEKGLELHGPEVVYLRVKTLLKIKWFDGSNLSIWNDSWVVGLRGRS